MPCYNGQYTLPTNVFMLLNKYLDMKDTNIKELEKSFIKYFDKGNLGIRRWQQFQNAIELIFSEGQPVWTKMNQAKVVVSIYPDGRVGLLNKDDKIMKKVESVLNEFSKIGTHNRKLKNMLLKNSESSLAKLGITQKNQFKQVKNVPLGSFSTSFTISDEMKNEAIKRITLEVKR